VSAAPVPALQGTAGELAGAAAFLSLEGLALLDQVIDELAAGAPGIETLDRWRVDLADSVRIFEEVVRLCYQAEEMPTRRAA
jgi:hypothetical protein